VSSSLTGKQLRYLRALGHSKKPVVQIGHGGLAAPVIAAIETALESHELIKIRISAEAGSDADELGDQIGRSTRSVVAQVIGRTVLVYRRRQKDPVIVLPKAGARRVQED
jgi:RNA-binding protein